MADKVKIYYPDTIEDQPINTESVEAVDTTGSTSNTGAVGSGNSQEVPGESSLARPIPVPVVAKEVISNSLNTQTKQILGTYTFGKVGAMQIGEYVNGTSGDVRITPDGITARNSAGDTTFALDGTTGDASFAGTVTADATISASVSANLITGTIVDAQIAEVDWAKITNVVVENADIQSLTADKISSGTLSGIYMTIGTGNSVFKADANGIYLGNATFGSAPFRVNMSGAVTASSLTLTNASVGSGSSWTGNQIAEAYIGNLSASKITSGTINASVINVTNLNASNISTGDVPSARMQTNVLTALQASIANLSAINANIGTITSGSITGTTITTTSGGRINIKGSGAMQFQDSGGSNQGQIYGQNTTPSLIIAPTSVAQVQGDLDITGDLYMDSGEIKEVNTLYVNDIDDNGQGYVEIKDDLDVDGWFAGGSWASLNGDLDMNSHDINECTGVNPPSNTYVGQDNLVDVVRSMQYHVGKRRGKWAELDHSKVHPTIKKKWTKKILDKTTNKIIEVEKEGYGLFELVLVQNRLLVELSDRITVLEQQNNGGV